MYDIIEYDKQKTKVLKYIMYKKRTEQEIKQKFFSSIDEYMLEDIIEELKQKQYINDDNYIQRAVNEMMVLQKLSKKELKYKLMSKGLDANKIETYFSKIQEELDEYELDSAKKIVIKKLSLMEEEEVIQFLLKKGYEMDSIKNALSEVNE